MANRFRRDGFIISVEGVRARGTPAGNDGAPGIKFKFGDIRDGKVVPFTLSNGVPVNPAPSLTMFRAQKGDIAKNEEINRETLKRLGYTGNGIDAPTVGQFTSGATRAEPKSVEISWDVTEYGNEVTSVRGKDEDEDGSAFFTGAKAKGGSSVGDDDEHPH